MNYVKDFQVLDKMEIVIKDACILFDLVDLNLLDEFFNLELKTYTTVQVISEITNEKQWEAIDVFIQSRKLIADNNGGLQEIMHLNSRYPGLSLTDSSVLELAIRKQAIVYSSDGGLRKASTKEGITTRGILWIIEELFSLKILSKEEAIHKLNNYESINERAPTKEIKTLKLKILKYDT